MVYIKSYRYPQHIVRRIYSKDDCITLLPLLRLPSDDAQHELQQRKSWNGVYRWPLLTTADVCL